MVERAHEIGGCELLRVAQCPVALGTFTPAITVQCASGRHICLPVANEASYEHNGKSGGRILLDQSPPIRELVASHLGTATDNLAFAHACDGCPPVQDDTRLIPGMSLLCIQIDQGATEKLFQQALYTSAFDEKI